MLVGETFISSWQVRGKCMVKMFLPSYTTHLNFGIDLIINLLLTIIIDTKADFKLELYHNNKPNQGYHNLRYTFQFLSTVGY